MKALYDSRMCSTTFDSYENTRIPNQSFEMLKEYKMSEYIPEYYPAESVKYRETLDDIVLYWGK